MTTSSNQPPAAGADNPLVTDEFADLAKKTLDEWKVPGLAIGVVDGDNVFTHAYGWAKVDSKPAKPETLWYAASTTKAFLAATLAHLIDSKAYPQLLERGWAMPISSIIHDDFVLQDEWATQHLTLEDAVCHRTGMPRHDRSSQRFIVDGDDDANGSGRGSGSGKRWATIRDIVRNLRNLPATCEPRTKFVYNNLMYVALSHVIETLTGKPLGDVLRETIWEPLGMRSTYFDLDEALAAPEGMADSHYFDEAAGKFKEVPAIPLKEIGGAGAIISNTHDFARWVQCLLNRQPPFSEAVHNDIRTPRIISGMPESGKDVRLYGLGWIRSTYHGHVLYEHSGGMHASGSHVYWLPDANFAVVGFASTFLTANAAIEVLAYRLISDKLGIKPEPEDSVETRWTNFLRKADEAQEHSLSSLYPNMPDPPLPSPVHIKDLTGTYYHPGYNSITLRVEQDSDEAGKEVLVAERDDVTWELHMRFHVSAQWWMVRFYAPSNPFTHGQDYEKAEFKIGPDGKPTGLEIELYTRLSDQYEGVILFKKLGV